MHGVLCCTFDVEGLARGEVHNPLEPLGGAA
jgi:hypothetical protein